ncbi:unannotated protein [freshwater metagenome]|uniref:Unannotated protein n=1 Tax=freshwater metagenome TaxID=449393 RepID=A0A6J6C1V6_9ZZZZ
MTVRDHRPTLTGWKIADPCNPACIVLMHQRSAASGGQQLRAETNEASSRSFDGDNGATGIARSEVGDTTLSRSKSLGDGADMFIGHIDYGALEWFMLRAVDVLHDDLWPADLKFITFTTHRLDEHRKLKLATTRNLDDVWRLSRLDLD